MNAVMNEVQSETRPDGIYVVNRQSFPDGEYEKTIEIINGLVISNGLWFTQEDFFSEYVVTRRLK